MSVVALCIFRQDDITCHGGRLTIVFSMESTNQSAKTREHTRHLGRLRIIHREVSSGRCPRTCDLAQRFGCTERTIKRDFAYLRDQLEAPLVYDRERRGWRYTNPGWDFTDIPLTEGELLAFFVAEHALKATGQAPEAILLRTGLAKLAARLPTEISVNANNLGEALSFQHAPHVAVDPHILHALARAAAERRTIAFTYHSQHRNQETRREVDVLHLHNFIGDWYAIAYDHLRREVRDFHAGRIKDLRETKKFFDPPDNWHQDKHFRSGFTMMRGGRKTTVSILFDAYQSRWMRERHTFHPDETREDLPDGSLRLTFPVGHNGLEAVARFVCNYAGHCCAERPTALRKIIRERLTRALKDHQEN